jgi:tetratricopeptide (TPR) repeat protein
MTSERETSAAASTGDPSSEILQLWTVPYARNPYFTGRDPLLEQLHHLLAHAHRAALSQSAVLNGLGGIGKTQTAIEYAYRHVHDYTAVFWIEAETTERLVTSFVTLAETLNLPERQESEKPQVVSAVLRWLKMHQGWLLIFDNVEDLEIVRSFVPTVPHGSILFTTRLQAVGTLAQQVTVETMGLAEGTLLLLRRAKLLPTDVFLDQVSPELLEEAESLVIELDFLPLAIDQAGAYIEEVGCSPAAYLELYQSCRKQLLHRRGHTPSDHPDSVAATWSLSFQRIEQRNPAAADLLRMCAFLEPDAIPEELLQEGCLTLGSLMQAVATDMLAFHAACEELSLFSLVQRDPQSRLLRIHRLVQAVLKESMEIKEQQRWVEHLLRATDALFPATVDATTWPLCQRVLPQAQMGSLWAERFTVASPQAASLLLRTAHYLQDVALYEQAKQLSQQVIAIRERMLKQEHLEMAQSLHALAQVYREQGNYAEAEPFYQRALHILEQMVGEQHPDTVSVLHNMADLYRRQSRYAEAEPLYQRALRIREQQLGPEHPQVAHSLHGLALLYDEQGRYAEAEPLFQRALAIREQCLGPDHPDVALSLNGLAMLYYEQGKYAEAEPLYQRALAIREQRLGPDHPDVAHPLANLALLYWQQGKQAKAKPLYQRALAIREQRLGPDHPLVAQPLNGLAILYYEQGRYEEAEPLYQRALALLEQRLEPDHPDVVFSLNNLAILYAKQYRYAEAEPLFLRVISLLEQRLGADHPDMALSLNNLAMLYYDQGKYAEAEPLYQRALAIWEQRRGPDHPLVAHPLNGLANLYCEQGKYEEAERFFLRALRIREQQLGSEHPDLAATLHEFAALRVAQGNFQDAAFLYQRALTMREQVFGSQHPKTTETRERLRAVLQTTGKVEEAATLRATQPFVGS